MFFGVKGTSELFKNLLIVIAVRLRQLDRDVDTHWDYGYTPCIARSYVGTAPLVHCDGYLREITSTRLRK